MPLMASYLSWSLSGEKATIVPPVEVDENFWIAIGGLVILLDEWLDERDYLVFSSAYSGISFKFFLLGTGGAYN